MSKSPSNRRILLVDDNPAIHDDFRKLLLADNSAASIDEEAERFFGAEKTDDRPQGFELDSAHQGEEALGKVKAAMAAQAPYAMAFVDMRMPPGWDGLETIQRIWSVYPDLEIVICTAYSDYSWDEIQKTLGVSDHLLILKKPFDKVEVQQIALALTEKWNLRCLNRRHTEKLEEAVAVRTRDLHEEKQNLRLIQVVAEAANEAPSPGEAIAIALARICAHSKWSVGHAYLCSNAPDKELISVGLWHHDESLCLTEFRQASEQIRFRPGVGLPGRVLQGGKAVWIEDVTSDIDFPRAAAANSLGLKAAMAFPLLIGTETVGVLEFFAQTVQPLDPRMLEVMSHVGAQLGRVVERQKARESLERSEAYFRSLTDNALDLITLIQVDGTIRYESRSIEHMLGYTTGEFRGKHFFDFLHPDDAGMFAETFRNLRSRGGDSGQIVFRFRHRNGSYRLLEGTGKNLLTDPVVGAIIFNARDITERKKLEEQFLQSQKVQAIGQLAGGIAHDFNNILTAIIGYTDLLLKQMPRTDSLHLSAEEIKKAATRAASLTRQLLAFSRKQVLQPRVLDLNDVVADMDKMLRRLLGENIQLLAVPRADLGRVKADSGQIEQVLMNLAVNGRDAMGCQGKLTIETANVTLDGEYCRHRADVTPGEYVMLAVTDNGAGIPPEVRSRLFEPFFTTKEIGKGTGLGLATCHGIVRQSGGHIAVYSEVGRGTTFKIYLPRVQEELAGAARVERPPVLKSGTETVLLVEDEPMLRELGLLVLSGLGYRVLPADNGVQAMRVLEQHRGQKIHLLVTDVVMPEMGGRELSEHVRAVSPQTKVLFCSGYTEDSIFHEGTLDEGISFLQKPYTIASFASKVRSVLELEEDAA